MSEKLMKLKLHIWRQPTKDQPGAMKDYVVEGVSEHMSFLEMMDTLNEQLMNKGEEPVAFDHDCREGICGMCSMVINGIPHGGHKGVTVCQLHMRHFKDGDAIFIEPWRARAFPVLRDLVVDRQAFDRIVAAGGYVSVATGGAPDANALPIPKKEADLARPRTWGTCRRVKSSGTSERRTWPCRWTPRASAPAATSRSARRCVPRRSASGSSPSSTATWSRPSSRAEQ